MLNRSVELRETAELGHNCLEVDPSDIQAIMSSIVNINILIIAA